MINGEGVIRENWLECCAGCVSREVEGGIFLLSSIRNTRSWKVPGWRDKNCVEKFLFFLISLKFKSSGDNGRNVYFAAGGFKDDIDARRIKGIRRTLLESIRTGKFWIDGINYWSGGADHVLWRDLLFCSLYELWGIWK